MIFGIGADLVDIARMTALWERHGARAASHILAPEERADCFSAREPARFLAKRFAAKEALGKALGTGIRAPVLLTAIAVCHETNGRPFFSFSAPLAAWLAERRLICHLSLSDEAQQAMAFVVVERQARHDVRAEGP